jgi:hypothetical protein
MGPVSLVPDWRGKGTFPYYTWGTEMCPPYLQQCDTYVSLDVRVLAIQ